MPGDEMKLVGMLAGVGFVVGAAKLLVSDERVTWRGVVGRAVLSGALGLAAGAVVIFIPGVSFVGQVGLACLLTSLGSSALESVLQYFIKGKCP